MHAKLHRVLGLTAFVWVLGAGLLRAESKPAEIFPLDSVRRGQKGYGITTMQGTEPERFEFEVIGINRNFLPKMDIILVKSEDPKLKTSGFWQGMSGSPLYIEGKVACAFSYGFRFNKLAIGGCTPLQYMVDEGFQTRRGAPNVKTRTGKLDTAYRKSRPAPRSAKGLAQWLGTMPGGNLGSSLTRQRSNKPWALSSGLPKAIRLADTERGMQPSALPLAMSGFSAPAFKAAKELLSDFPLVPMQAGGTGNSNEGPNGFQMGGAIAVQLIRGDMSAASTGTVSYVDGDQVLAFGHPMFQAGEIYAPVAAAEIHTVIPSAQSAFIVSSPLRELGALTQDRQSTVAADTSLKVDMIPMDITLKERSGKELGHFDIEILDNRFFTATFAMIAASNAASLYLPDRDHVSLRMKSRVEMKDYPALEFDDYLHSSSGASGIMGAARGLRVISPLLNNPFGPVEVSAIHLEVEVGWDTNVVEIVGLSLPSKKLAPGRTNEVDVTLEPYRGERFTQRFSFDVPDKLAGSIVKLEVTAGDAAGLYIAPPRDLDDLVAAFQSFLPGTVYALTLYSADEAAAIDGRLVQDLPSSAINKLRAAGRTPKLATRNVQVRSLQPAKRVVEGEATVLVKVDNL